MERFHHDADAEREPGTDELIVGTPGQEAAEDTDDASGDDAGFCRNAAHGEPVGACDEPTQQSAQRPAEKAGHHGADIPHRNDGPVQRRARQIAVDAERTADDAGGKYEFPVSLHAEEHRQKIASSDKERDDEDDRQRTDHVGKQDAHSALNTATIMR